MNKENNLNNFQIRIHGRGGQGVVALAEILAIAFFNDGKFSQAFPHFGVERSGAPIQSFVKVSDQEILSREHVYLPDSIIILDDSLLKQNDVFSGLRASSKILVNSKLSREEIFSLISRQENGKKIKLNNIFSWPASDIALEIFGKNIVNTIILAALTEVLDFLSFSSAVQAVEEKFFEKGSAVIDKNIIAMKKVIK